MHSAFAAFPSRAFSTAKPVNQLHGNQLNEERKLIQILTTDVASLDTSFEKYFRIRQTRIQLCNLINDGASAGRKYTHVMHALNALEDSTAVEVSIADRERVNAELTKSMLAEAQDIANDTNMPRLERNTQLNKLLRVVTIGGERLGMLTIVPDLNKLISIA